MVIDLKKGNMGNVTVSLTEEEEKQFKKLQNEETRGPSDQFRHMMKFYVENKT